MVDKTPQGSIVIFNICEVPPPLSGLICPNYVHPHSRPPLNRSIAERES